MVLDTCKIAAPIHRPWLEYWLVFKPAASSALLSRCLNSDCDKGLPSSTQINAANCQIKNKGWQWTHISARMPHKMHTPSLVRSVFDLQRWRRIVDSLYLNFTAMSCTQIDRGDDIMNSPTLIKPKKPTQAVAQSTNHPTLLSWCMTNLMMGRHCGLFVPPFLCGEQLMPLNASRRWGISAQLTRLPPCEISRFLMLAR